jgi:hypothetical protein
MSCSFSFLAGALAGACWIACLPSTLLSVGATFTLGLASTGFDLKGASNASRKEMHHAQKRWMTSSGVGRDDAAAPNRAIKEVVKSEEVNLMGQVCRA